jgi:hypothetical protein
LVLAALHRLAKTRYKHILKSCVDVLFGSSSFQLNVSPCTSAATATVMSLLLFSAFLNTEHCLTTASATATNQSSHHYHCYCNYLYTLQHLQQQLPGTDAQYTDVAADSVAVAVAVGDNRFSCALYRVTADIAATSYSMKCWGLGAFGKHPFQAQFSGSVFRLSFQAQFLAVVFFNKCVCIHVLCSCSRDLCNTVACD